MIIANQPIKGERFNKSSDPSGATVNDSSDPSRGNGLTVRPTHQGGTASTVEKKTSRRPRCRRRRRRRDRRRRSPRRRPRQAICIVVKAFHLFSPTDGKAQTAEYPSTVRPSVHVA